MVAPHWTICPTLSTEPSVPEFPSCGVGADVVDTDAFATPPTSASDHIKAADITVTIVLRITSPPLVPGGRSSPAGSIGQEADPHVAGLAGACRRVRLVVGRDPQPGRSAHQVVGTEAAAAVGTGLG